MLHFLPHFQKGPIFVRYSALPPYHVKRFLTALAARSFKGHSMAFKSYLLAAMFKLYLNEKQQLGVVNLTLTDSSQCSFSEAILTSGLVGDFWAQSNELMEQIYNCV